MKSPSDCTLELCVVWWIKLLLAKPASHVGTLVQFPDALLPATTLVKAVEDGPCVCVPATRVGDQVEFLVLGFSFTQT